MDLSIAWQPSGVDVVKCYCASFRQSRTLLKVFERTNSHPRVFGGLEAKRGLALTRQHSSERWQAKEL